MESLDDVETRRSCVFKKPSFPLTNEPDLRFYSGRNPVPRIESLWDLYPDRGSSSDGSVLEGQKRKKILEHTNEVLDPITGKKWVYIEPSLFFLMYGR